MALQCTDEDNNIHAGMCKISNGAKKRHVELVQFGAAKVFGLCMLHLSMYNRPEVAHIHELVQSDLCGMLVLYVAHSTNL